MSKYKIKIVIENEKGEVLKTREKEVKVKDNDFDNVDLELYKFKNEIMPEIGSDIFELEQKEYKKNR